MKQISEIQLSNLRKLYPEGSLVELIYTDDPYTELQSGDTGTVVYVDDMGTVHINWSNGSTLGLVPGVDQFRRL